jgi:hypothetical protein
MDNSKVHREPSAYNEPKTRHARLGRRPFVEPALNIHVQRVLHQIQL